MAVINLEGIKERGKLIKAQAEEQRKIEEGSFWRRVETIRKSQKDCINFIDTCKELFANGMKQETQDWMKNQKKIQFYFVDSDHHINRYNFDNEPAFFLSLSNDKYDLHPSVAYYPKSNNIVFSVAMYGSTSILHTPVDKIIEQTLKSDGGKFNKGLTELATYLQPFLDDFYEWVMAL
jgi:hypothetical protein